MVHRLWAVCSKECWRSDHGIYLEFRLIDVIVFMMCRILTVPAKDLSVAFGNLLSSSSSASIPIGL